MAIGDIVDGKLVCGEARPFRVYCDGSYSGPAEYIKHHNITSVQKWFDAFLQDEAADVSPAQALAVALQTDYTSRRGIILEEFLARPVE